MKCADFQKYTDYATWEKSTDVKEGRVDALYDVLWQDPWEPFYIGRTNVPFYDERFRQYGFNRISQVSSLCCWSDEKDSLVVIRRLV